MATYINEAQRPGETPLLQLLRNQEKTLREGAYYPIGTASERKKGKQASGGDKGKAGGKKT